MTYTDSLFSINILSNWVASTTLANASSQPDDPLKTVSFALPTDLEDPVLYIKVYRHGVQFTDVDEPPTFLGSNGQYDFYFQKLNGDSDPTILTPLNLTDDELQNDLTQSIASFQFTIPTSPATSSPTTQAQTSTSTWQTYVNTQYGFSFSHPVISSADYEPTASQEVNDYNASSTALSFNDAFYIEIQENQGNLSLKDWFEKNIDDNGILLTNQNFKLITNSNGVQALEEQMNSTFPDEYIGDAGIPYDQWYVATMDGDYIISYNFDYQDDGLGGYGIPNDDGTILGQDILSTFKFTN